MPRRAPDNVEELRVTFGNYERNFVTEVKTDIETAAKVAATASLAVPIAAVAGAAFLGWGIYQASIEIGKGLSDFDFLGGATNAKTGLGFLTFGLYDSIADASFKEQNENRAKEGLPPIDHRDKSYKDVPANLGNFLAFWITGKGIVWGRNTDPIF